MSGNDFAGALGSRDPISFGIRKRYRMPVPYAWGLASEDPCVSGIEEIS